VPLRHARKITEIYSELGQELNKFKLNLNLNKTYVVDLPEPISDDWVSELAACLPTTFIDEKYNKRKYLLPELLNYLDRAVVINKRTPDGSVLKYAVKSISSSIDDYAVPFILNYVISLSWHFPLLLPCIDNLLSHELTDPNDYTERLNEIIIENAKNYRSDGMAWPLYYLKKYQLPVSDEASDLVYKSRDCIALVCLYSLGSLKDQIIQFANGLVCKTNYEKDQYWLLLYQLYREDLTNDVYEDNQVFKVMKENEVNFLQRVMINQLVKDTAIILTILLQTRLSMKIMKLMLKMNHTMNGVKNIKINRLVA
jgi:hypothetical protein